MIREREPRATSSTNRKQRYCQQHRRAHAGRRGRRRRRLPRLLGRRRADAPRWSRRWRASRSSWRWPTPSPRSGPSWPRRCGPTASSPPAARDYPNQVNNVLCFPYIFRGALDCGATKITEAMKLACVREIAELAKAETSDEVAAAYAGQGAALRPRLPDPHAVRLAPDPAHRAGGGAGRGRRRASRRGRSTTSRPTASR